MKKMKKKVVIATTASVATMILTAACGYGPGPAASETTYDDTYTENVTKDASTDSSDAQEANDNAQDATDDTQENADDAQENTDDVRDETQDEAQYDDEPLDMPMEVMYGSPESMSK